MSAEDGFERRFRRPQFDPVLLRVVLDEIGRSQHREMVVIQPVVDSEPALEVILAAATGHRIVSWYVTSDSLSGGEYMYGQ